METRTTLYPPVKKPFLDGYLRRGIHEIYFEICGNPKGYPVVFIHGGPGSGCSETHRRFFDPDKWKVILFDQRGSGRSRPAGCLAQNTTWHLVEDMKYLLDTFKIKEAMFWGGSWGATLIPVYAIKYPETVSAMILRGVWLGERAEVDYYINGGVKQNFPEVWERFASQVPRRYQDNPARYYYEKLLFGTPKEKEHFAYEWARYEEKLLFLRQKTDKEVKEALKGSSFVSWATIEAHYCMRHLFLEDGYIMKHVRRIAHIPTTIIHGRYDLLCFPESAYRLHKALHRSKLVMPLAGHYATDPEIQKSLIVETNLMFDQLAKRKRNR